MLDKLPWKRNKNNHAEELHREIDNIYDRFFEPDFMPSSYIFGNGKWGPKLDISEGRKNIIVKAEIPGIEAKDLDITIDGRRLNIRGEKKQEQTEEEETYYRIERSYGYFNRTIELSAESGSRKSGRELQKGYSENQITKDEIV